MFAAVEMEFWFWPGIEDAKFWVFVQDFDAVGPSDYFKPCIMNKSGQ